MKLKEQQDGNHNKLLTIGEVASILRVDATTVRRWVKNGSLSAITLPHPGSRQSYRVREEEIDALLNPPTRKQAS